MSWNKSSKISHIWIFPVGRGNAAFISTALRHGFILDLGGGDFVDPPEFIKQNLLTKLQRYPDSNGKLIAQAILSHPHEDHIKLCGKLRDDDQLHPSFLTCPHDKPIDGADEKINWSRIRHDDGSNEKLINTYQSLYEKRNPPLQTITYEGNVTVPNLEYGIFYVRPPVCEKLHPADNNKYCNATSILTYFRQGNHSILFPGDVTPEALSLILGDKPGIEKRYTRFSHAWTNSHPTWSKETADQPSLRSLLQDNGLTVLVAPHHGLESCYSEELFSSIKGGKPNIVVLSERRKKREGDGHTDKRYQSEQGATGLNVSIDGEQIFRRSVSTVNGHNILISLPGNGSPSIQLNKNPHLLLSSIN